MSIPRIRGRVAQIEEPIDDKGKWVYEMSLWDLSGENRVGEPWIFGPYDTEEAAKATGKELVRKACDVITGEPSEKYLDMKNGGILRPWDLQ